MSSIQIRKFDPSSIDPCRVCVFIGRRGTGKSQLVTDILYHKRKIPAGIVISGTEESNEHYQEFVPDSCIYGKYDPEVINKITNNQAKVVKKLSSEDKKDFTITKPSVFMLLDDCMYDNKWTRSDVMRRVFMNGRHYRILFLLTIQYVMDLPPSLRGQCDYIFILKENIHENKIKIWKHLFGIFKTFEAFDEVLTQCTEDYQCLVLNVRSTSNKIEDVVFWYKAKVGRKFKVGSKELWEFHKRNYNPKYSNDEDSEQPNSSKKKKEVVNVIKTDITGKKKKKNKLLIS